MRSPRSYSTPEPGRSSSFQPGFTALRNLHQSNRCLYMLSSFKQGCCCAFVALCWLLPGVASQRITSMIHRDHNTSPSQCIVATMHHHHNAQRCCIYIQCTAPLQVAAHLSKWLSYSTSRPSAPQPSSCCTSWKSPSHLQHSTTRQQDMCRVCSPR
jgi:hypothetical protein